MTIMRATSRGGLATLTVSVLLVLAAVFSCPAGSVYQVINLVGAAVLIGGMFGVLQLRARRVRKTGKPVRDAMQSNVTTSPQVRTAEHIPAPQRTPERTP